MNEFNWNDLLMNDPSLSNSLMVNAEVMTMDRHYCNDLYGDKVAGLLTSNDERYQLEDQHFVTMILCGH